MSAMIAGGIASVRGHEDAATIAIRSLEIAKEIDERVSVIERSAPPPSDPPTEELLHVDPAEV
jgi:hypothetical protein